MVLAIAGLGEAAQEPTVKFRGFLAIDFGNGDFLYGESEEAVAFDLDGDGVAERVGWTESVTSYGFLFLDENGNGLVDGGAELLDANGGYDVLSAADLPESVGIGRGGNVNGFLDAPDSLWPRLRVWIDANHNGSSEPSEIFTLNQKDVTEIDLSFCRSTRVTVCKAVTVRTPQGGTTKHGLHYIVVQVRP